MPNKKRIFAAGLLCEVNTFTSFPTLLKDFQESCYVEAGCSANADHYYMQPLMTMKKLVQNEGWEYIKGLCAGAPPGGKVNQQDYELMRDQCLADLQAAMPVDAVFLYLHGAMMADHCDDCEGDILKHVRNIVGADVFIGVELDPHTHLSAQMVDQADVLVSIKEYPHIDYNARAQDIFHLMKLSLLDGVSMQSAVANCDMIDVYPTTIEPMKGFLDKVIYIEESDPHVLSISIIHGFPWGDMIDMGTKVLVISDKHYVYSESIAKKLAEELKCLFGKTMQKTYSIEEALAFVQSQQAKFPVTFADYADNTGLGALGDSTFILKEVLRSGIKQVAVSPLYDPEAVAQAFAAGEGAAINVCIGGKGPFSGDTLQLSHVNVLLLSEALTVDFSGSQVGYGRCATLEYEGVYIVVSTLRAQTFSVECFTKMGINPKLMKILIAKSTEHFRHSFRSLNGSIIAVETPGLGILDFKQLPYKHINTSMRPFKDPGE